MSYSVSRFVQSVESLACSVQSYRNGGTGKDGTCDCVGLIMGAMYNLGRGRYDMHSSNYFARFQTDNMVDISVAVLKVGDIVYKRRDSIADLNARYQLGGRYYNGDLWDYYHVGVVTCLSPLVITHCTSGKNAPNGIARDSTSKAWHCVGKLKGVDYTCEYNPAYTETQTSGGAKWMSVTTLYKATVIADMGSTVNLRGEPKANGKLIRKVPIGTRVDVWENADANGTQWSHIKVPTGEVGYMMSQFLEADAPVADDDYTIPTDPNFTDDTDFGDDEIITLRLSRTMAEALVDMLADALANG